MAYIAPRSLGTRARGRRYSRQDGQLKGYGLVENKMSSDDV